MNEIQIDMFEVQLGAALLLQFGLDGDTISVLADAGVKASKYPPEHVHSKLSKVLKKNDRIDLIIGTHYDEDHLDGLVPIIRDESIEIGEAWMPPVVNDALAVAFDRPVAASDLLAHQFATEQGGAVLAHYLAAKRADIEALGLVEAALQGRRPDDDRGFKVEPRTASDDPHNIDFFREQLGAADDDGDIDHGCDMEIEPNPLVTKLVDEVTQSIDTYWFPEFETFDALKSRAARQAGEVPALAATQARSIAHLRKSTAKKAINAKALHDVAVALHARKIPIRTEIIEDGVPHRYRWSARSQRFVLGPRNATGLCFDLLGPSRSLVKKHRDKLPVVETAKIAMAFRGELQGISPSNQLSYIGCFRHKGQSILVSGDAGCVDFKLDRDNYYPQLLAAMSPLHVVQVAHHAGNNAHFYRVLAAAGFPEQTEPSLLLLSHKTRDPKRPSPAFREFLLTSLREGDDIKLLFTSEPRGDRVRDFRQAIHPQVGASGTVGDIQLVYDGRDWQVIAHAISMP